MKGTVIFVTLAVLFITLAVFAWPASAQRMKLVGGELVPMTLAEETERDKAEQDFINRVEPVPPALAGEIWGVLKAKGIVTDADLPAKPGRP